MAWLSAHVYLGLSLLVIATLHTGFHFGWNIHMLAYVLMCLVIASGGFGVFSYARHLWLMTEIATAYDAANAQPDCYPQ